MNSKGTFLPVIQPEKAASKAAAFAATGAVLCGVCCVLPFALPAAALATSGSLLAWFGRAQSSMTLLAAAIVAAAWIWVALTSARAKAKPATATLYTMGGATLVLLLAVIWPRIEPFMIEALRRGQ